jgi:ABC-type amino acid transport substrate-binding protein
MTAGRRCPRGVLTWVLAALGLVAWPQPSAASDLPEAKQRGMLRAIVAADEAPETFARGAGGDPGFERELLEGFVRLEGMTLEAITAKGYADRIPMLRRGEGDLIVAIFDTEDRRRLVDFTVEVMPTHNVAVTLSPRPPVATLAELRSLRVGVVKGTKPAETALEAGVPAAALTGFATREDLVDGLQRGQVLAVILPVSELAVCAKRVAGLQAGLTVGPRGKVAWAVRRQDRALRDALDRYLGNVRRGPTWSRLIVKYFGDQALSVLGRAE